MIRIIKKFDVIPSEIKEMMGDVRDDNISHISLNVCGILYEFNDAEINVCNGFLKIIHDDNITLIRYRDLSSYSLHTVRDVISFNESDVDELWDELSSASSSLSPSSLMGIIPHDDKSHIIEDFISTYEGYRDEDAYDERMCEMYDGWIECVTYGDLNDVMRDYIWSFINPSHVIWSDVINGIYEVKSLEDLRRDLMWINDIISDYMEGDEDE